MADISKGKLLTWLRNASEATAEGHERMPQSRTALKAEVRIMGVLTEKIIEGQFDVENVLGESGNPTGM